MINMIMLIIYKEFILCLSLILLVDPLTLTFFFYHCLFFTLILHLKVLFNSSSSPSSSSLLLLLLLLLLLFIIYIVHLPMVRPRSCRVIYYFNTPTLGIRHQLFDRVRGRIRCSININK